MLPVTEQLNPDSLHLEGSNHGADPQLAHSDAARPQSSRRRRFHRRQPNSNKPRQPLAAVRYPRVVFTTLMGAMAVLSAAGGVLMLMLWQQESSSGVLTSQLERVWDLFDVLRQIERFAAFTLVPAAVVWAAVATHNVGRATGRRRSELVAALSIPLAIAGVWAVGDAVVAPAEDWVSGGAGVVLQVVFVLIPLVVFERIAETAESRRRPLRFAVVLAALYLALLQGLGGLSNITSTNDPAEWSKLGGYLIVLSLVQVLGAIAVNEAGRALEDGAQHRYELRHAFGESVLSQSALT